MSDAHDGSHVLYDLNGQTDWYIILELANESIVANEEIVIGYIMRALHDHIAVRRRIGGVRVGRSGWDWFRRGSVFAHSIGGYRLGGRVVGVDRRNVNIG